jgi:hypothetical protein
MGDWFAAIHLRERRFDMSSATQGPWKLFQFGGPQIGNANTGEAVCTMWGNDKDKNDSIHANAKLIAAAPDLLEALRNFTDGRDIAYTDALVIARAALAKATGAA